MTLSETELTKSYDFHDRYAQAMLDQGKRADRYMPDILTNFEGTAFLNPDERRNVMKVTELDELLNIPVLRDLARGIVLYDISLEAGLGTSFSRARHLQKYGLVDGRGENPPYGSKSTDTYYHIQGPDGPTGASVRAIRLQRSIESAGSYNQVIEQPVVSHDSMAPIMRIYDLPTVRSRMGRESDRTFRDAIAATPNFSSAEPILQPPLPTINATDRTLNYEHLLPGGHGHAAAIVIDRIATTDLISANEVTQISNGDGLNYMTPEVVAAAVYGGAQRIQDETGSVSEEGFEGSAFTIITTDACECDIKGGKAGLKMLSNGRQVPYLLEVGQVKPEQKGLFYQMGQKDSHFPEELAARHQPGEQIFNTNTVLVVHKPIHDFLRAVKDQLGENYYSQLLMPEFFEDASGDHIKIEGAMGSLILRLNEMIETNDELMQIWIDVSDGRDFIRIINIPREQRDEYFGPIKVGADRGEKDLNHHEWDPDELRFRNLRPGHTVHWAGDFGQKGAKPTDVTAFAQALGDADVLYLDEIDVQGYCLFADAIHGGKERIVCEYVPQFEGDVFDLNSPAAREQLGQPGTQRLNLINLDILIDESGRITVSNFAS